MSDTRGPFDHIPPVDGEGTTRRPAPNFIGHTRPDRGREPQAPDALLANAPRPNDGDAADQSGTPPGYGRPQHPGAAPAYSAPAPAATPRGITPLVITGGVLGIVASLVFMTAPILPLWTDGHHGFWNLFTAPGRSMVPVAIGGAMLIGFVGFLVLVASAIAIPFRKLRGASLGLGITAALCGFALLGIGFAMSRSGVGPAFGMWIAVAAGVLCAVAGLMQVLGTPKQR